MIHRILGVFVMMGLGLAASPAAAQQAAPNQLPTEDQTVHSVPPAPPPPRTEAPPPFPPMSRTPPHRRRMDLGRGSTRAAHHRSTQHVAKHHATQHAALTTHHRLTKQEKKDERWCANLSRRQALRNSKCRALAKQQREVTHLRQLTKQDKKDERRCAGLSLRQVLRSSVCRKVAERQLGAERDDRRHADHGAKHRHRTSRHETADRTKHRRATKRRGR
jgi:hypothetical protein